MPPKKQDTQNYDQRDDTQNINWVEFRSTLLTMQETMQRNIQNSIQRSIHELGETLIENLQSRHQAERRDVNTNINVDVNPFALMHQAGNQDVVLRRQDQRDSRWESGFRVEIPEFAGGVHGDSLIDWITTVEEVLEFKQVPDDRCVPLVATKFCGHTASWWQQLKLTRARANMLPIQSWSKLKKKLRVTFLLHNYDHTMYTRLQNLRQGSRTVDEYAEEFYILLTINEIHDSEIQIVSRFIGGLRNHLQNSLTQFDPTSVAEAHRRAASFEQQQRSTNWSSSTNRSRSQDTLPSQPETKARDIDTTTGSSNRSLSTIDEKPVRRSARNALRCFGCGEPGHRQSACQLKPAVDYLP